MGSEYIGTTLWPNHAALSFPASHVVDNGPRLHYLPQILASPLHINMSTDIAMPDSL